jgi:hypothetical protein
MNIDEIQNVAEAQIAAAGGDPAMLARWHTVYLLAQLVRINEPPHQIVSVWPDYSSPSPFSENAEKVEALVAQSHCEEFGHTFTSWDSTSEQGYCKRCGKVVSE